MNIDFMLGSDPECFLIDSAGKFISVVGKIGGTKMAPMPLPIGDGFAVQEDNVAVEFNIPPSPNVEVFSKNIMDAMSYLSFTVDRMGLKFSEDSAKSFDADQLLTPESQEFGCEPDFNAWRNGAVNPRPKAKDKALRTCGGHVHVGFDHEKVSHLSLIRYMDLYLGVPSVLMDKGETRKQLYGCAGAFRKKHYGAEYRTLSNFWIFKPELHAWVWRNTQRALESAMADTPLDDGDMIVAAINKNNKDTARELVQRYNLEVI